MFKNWEWAWLLPVLAFVLNSLFLAYDLPQVLHPDEPQVVRRAIAMGSGDLNPHYFVQPTLWIYLVFFAQSVGAVVGLGTGLFKGMDELAVSAFTNPTYYFSTARLLAALLGSGAVWLTWRLGCQFSRLCGWVGAVSLSVFAPFVWQAHYATTDVPLLFFVLMGLIACICGLRLRATKWESFWWPAICAGLAISIKYSGVVLFGALLVMFFLQVRQEQETWRSYVSRLLGAGVIAMLATLVTSPYLVLEFSTFLEGGRRILNEAIIVRDIEPNPWAYARLVVANQGVVFPALAMVGWGLLATPWGRSYRSIGWVLAGFFLPYLAVIELTDYKAPRWYLPLAPLSGIGAGLAMSRLSDWMQSLEWSFFLRGVVICLFVVALLLPSLNATFAVERAFSKESASSMATRWFKSHVGPSSTVLVDARARVNLLPDRETVLRRMRLWQADGNTKAKQLVRVYSYYMGTDIPAQGYRLVPTESYLLNTFSSGYEPDKDFDVRRLEGVRYVIVPESVLNSPGEAQQDQFYQNVRRFYRVLHTSIDWQGQKIVILERV